MSENDPYRREALERMKGYFDEERLVTHTMRVLDYGEKILEGEGIKDGFYRTTVTLGCIFHDIGIPEAMRVHGSADAPYQEKEGPPIARRFLSGMKVRTDILERVCYIVAHHHTEEYVDGMDFKVIWEADFLVNVKEGNLMIEPAELPTAGRENIRSKTGTAFFKDLLKEM